jgi:hypothetical protein
MEPSRKRVENIAELVTTWERAGEGLESPGPSTTGTLRVRARVALPSVHRVRDSYGYGPHAFREVAVMPFVPFTTVWPAVVRLFA